MSVITPTIGRRVWFNPAKQNGIVQALESMLPFFLIGEGPLDAGIAHVNTDGTINVSVADSNGHMHAAQNVPLWDGTGDRPDSSTAFCEWMPYQLGQAQSQMAQQQTLVQSPGEPAPSLSGAVGSTDTTDASTTQTADSTTGTTTTDPTQPAA